jgi:hypothetical protein
MYEKVTICVTICVQLFSKIKVMSDNRVCMKCAAVEQKSKSDVSLYEVPSSINKR